MDSKQSNQNYPNIQKDKTYTLQNLLNKINRTEPVTFGNYYVNFNEIFPKNFDSKDYMKNHVSLFNDDFAEKKKFTLNDNCYHLQSNYFKVFDNETLIYIFYFMTRDILQLYSAEQLYENKWKYHINSQLWFTEIGGENEENEENEENNINEEEEKNEENLQENNNENIIENNEENNNIQDDNNNNIEENENNNNEENSHENLENQLDQQLQLNENEKIADAA